MDQLEFSYIPYTNVKWRNYFRKKQFLIKINIHLPSDLSASFLRIYLRKMKTYKEIRFIAALFIIAKS